MTLTKDISEDTIIFLIIISFLFKLILTDYTSGRLTVAINFSMFATVLIASRLPTHLQVTQLMLNSVFFFVLVPIGLSYLRRKISLIDFISSLAILGLDLWLLYDIDVVYVWLLCLGNILVNFMGPALMVYTYRFKNEIRGPWDEAVIRSD
jgi:phosphatidylinositol glycan class C protein